MEQRQILAFGEPDQPYFELSAEYTHPSQKLHIGGINWINVEQYYQACKFYKPESPRHMEYYHIIAACDSPAKALMLGQQKKKGGFAVVWVVNRLTDRRKVNDVIGQYLDLPTCTLWKDNLADEIMKKGQLCKFVQNPGLRQLLLGTGDRMLVNGSSQSPYWGVGSEGTGENKLGKLLMELRVSLSS